MIPYAYGAGLGPDAVATGSLVLPANGGTVIVPFLLPDTICAQSIVCRTTDTSGQHSLELIFCEDSLALARVGTFQAFPTFTANAAANRKGNLAAPVYLSGTAFLVIRNAGAQTSLATVAAGTLAGNHIGTATVAQSLAIADLSAQTWVAGSAIPLVRINGTVSIVKGAEL